MTQSGIYKIQSISKPERTYVGSAVYIRNRWADHLRTLRRGIHRNARLLNHYNKYGESDLIFTIVEPCFPIFLLAREQYYIDLLDPYFNICKVAGSRMGQRATEETKIKIGKASKNRFPSLESRELMRLSSTNRRHSAESRKKMSLLKQNQSQETKKKNSEACKRVWAERKATGKDKDICQHMKDAWQKRDKAPWNKGVKYGYCKKATA